jgi:hypothetical protein
MIELHEFDQAISQMERGVALHSAHSTGFLSYADINALVTELRPYLDQLKRFLTASFTVSSAYLLLCFVSWGLLEKSVHQKTEELAVNESAQGMIPMENVEISTFVSENQTDIDCQQAWGPLNETKIIELDQLEQLLFDKNKISERPADEPKLISHQVKSCRFIEHGMLLNSGPDLTPIFV